MTDVTDDGDRLTKINFGITPLTSRGYLENSFNEMYLWLQLKPSKIRKSPYQVNLIITPVMSRCTSDNSFWTSCPGSGSGPCVRRDLVCDGVVNCGQDSDEDEHVCRKIFKRDFQGWKG